MEIAILDGEEARRRIPELALVLQDCVAKGASVSFMNPFSLAEAIGYFTDISESVARQEIILFAAIEKGRAVATVQLHPTWKPNQPHRAEIAKMLVHSVHRKQGIGQKLLETAEIEAKKRGYTLLTLDTASGEAERLYTRVGYIKAGAIPNYALWPDGGYCDTVFYYKLIDG
ncbi:MAG: GNAT family N-acetyltransferase [Alphaproteobacteria bacterium]|nr:GNAT family N-acetyltransferase [Beijerinckiaceae bacterium]NBQ39779.1 GNAT family N-acetyltransferase [Alphaproteobacteria bacterium]